MRETDAIIERVRRINANIQHLELAIDQTMGQIKPGQSLLARVDTNSWYPYLRERWWAVDVNRETLIIERPTSVDYTPGQIVNVLGLVGQPYRFRKTLRNVLLVAYDTPPTSLLLIIPWLLGNNISVTLVLTGAAADYDTQHIATDVEVIKGEKDGFVWPNQVMTVGWGDQVFVAVNSDNETTLFNDVKNKFEELRKEIPLNYLFGIFQQPIPCGLGACSACMVQVRKGTQLACTDGPAFDLTQVILT